MRTRDKILAEATKQLLEQGYAAFTIAAVRDALGLSSGSMFHAFASKPALAAAVFVEGMRDYQTAAVSAIASHPDAETALREWIAAHLAWVEGHRDLAHFLFSTQPEELTALAAKPLADANTNFYTTVSELLDAAATCGLADHLPIDSGHAIVMGPAQEYCRRWTRGLATVTPTTHTTFFQGAALAALRSTLTGQ